MSTRGAPMPAGLKRLLWFVALWAAGVVVTGLVGLVIKLWLT